MSDRMSGSVPKERMGEAIEFIISMLDQWVKIYGRIAISIGSVKRTEASQLSPLQRLFPVHCLTHTTMCFLLCLGR